MMISCSHPSWCNFAYYSDLIRAVAHVAGVGASSLVLSGVPGLGDHSMGRGLARLTFPFACVVP